MLVEGLDKDFYSPRVYVAAETDKMSAKRALSREQTWAGSQVRNRSSSAQIQVALDTDQLTKGSGDWACCSTSSIIVLTSPQRGCCDAAVNKCKVHRHIWRMLLL